MNVIVNGNGNYDFTLTIEIMCFCPLTLVLASGSQIGLKQLPVTCNVVTKCVVRKQQSSNSMLFN